MTEAQQDYETLSQIVSQVENLIRIKQVGDHLGHRLGVIACDINALVNAEQLKILAKPRTRARKKAA